AIGGVSRRRAHDRPLGPAARDGSRAASGAERRSRWERGREQGVELVARVEGGAMSRIGAFVARRITLLVAVLATTLSTVPSTARAQSAIYGAGLQAWTGCWSAEQGMTSAGVGALVCVTPTANVNVADVATIQDGKVVGRE